MAVTLQIGQERYIAENAAEESTLEEILYAMQSQLAATTNQTSTISKNQKSQTINTQQSNSALGGFNQAARRTEDTLEDLENAANVTSGSLLDTARNVASGFNSAIKGMVSSLEKGEIDPRSMIENISGAVASGLSGLGTAAGAAIGSVVPVVGTAAGAAVGKFVGDGLGTTLTTLAGAVGMAIGIMDGFAKTTQALASDGVIFGDGLSKATKDILDQGLTMSMFSKLVQESGDDLRLLGGSATQGSKKLLKMFQSVENNKNEFINLGFAIEDIPGLMADYTASLQRFGVQVGNMSDADLRQNTLEYAKNLRLLADLTGDDVKTAKEKKRALLEESQLQSLITRMSESDVNAGDKINTAVRMIENLGFSTEDAIKFINRGVMTGDAAVMANAAGVGESLTGIRDNLLNSDPTIGVKEFTGNLLGVVKENIPKIKQSVMDLGDIAATGGDRAVAITAGLGKLNTFTRGIDSLNVDKFLENADKAAESQDKLAQGIASLEQSKVDMAKAVQGLATQLTSVSAPIITGAIDKLAVAIEASAAAITGGIETITSPGPATAEIQTGILNDLEFKNFKSGDDLGKGFFNDSDLADKIDELVDALDDSGKSQAEIVDELGKIGIKFDPNTNKYYKAEPTVAPVTPASPPISKPNDSISQPSSIPEKAYGDIVKPKSGGTIVRVAEAGEAEAIMPTAKTEKGELGIKVTGELIDSSYLMKTLVDTNKGGNGLLATLVSKLDDLNSSFEKLVYEQRQANRLAV